MKDEFKRAQHTGKYSYCPCKNCHDEPPVKKARARMKRDGQKLLNDHEYEAQYVGQD